MHSPEILSRCPMRERVIRGELKFYLTPDILIDDYDSRVQLKTNRKNQTLSEM